MAAPLPGVAVNSQRTQVTLTVPAAVAVAELGPNTWARVSVGGGTAARQGQGRGTVRNKR